MFEFLERIDRRIIFLFVAFSLSVPIVLDIRLEPAEMETAEATYDAIDELVPEEGKIVLIASDWGPGTLAENKPQTMLAMEHLMRKRIPFALISMYTLAVPFLEELPVAVKKRLEEEMPNQTWEYGKDWVNLGFRPGGALMIQGLAKADDLQDVLKVDARAVPLQDLPAMKGVHTIKDISMLMEFTGLVGAFNSWLQYFSGPVFIHGCTSITIPEAFIYYSSKQILGFFEGLAGAAYYEKLLYDQHPNRLEKSLALAVNSGLSFAQLGVLFFIALGNLGIFTKFFFRAKDE